MITLTEEDKSKIRIFAGSSSERLAQKIVKYLDMEKLLQNQMKVYVDAKYLLFSLLQNL